MYSTSPLFTVNCFRLEQAHRMKYSFSKVNLQVLSATHSKVSSSTLLR